MTLVQLAAIGVVASDVLGSAAIADWLGLLVHVGSVTLTRSTSLLDAAPWLSWRVPSPSAAIVAAYYVVLVGAVCLGRQAKRRRRSRVVLRVAVGAATALFLWIVVAPWTLVQALGDGRLHLLMFDVGQGDAMLVTFPNGRQLAVDSGGVSVRGDFDIGDRVIGPAIRARGSIGLDYLAVTHGDPDHIGGARALLRDFQPREIWWGVPVANHEATALVRAEAERIRAGWRTLQRGDRFEIGAVELRVHHPPLPDWERQRVRNDDSLVFELRLGEVSMLLTGDISRETEHQLRGSLALGPLVVLKVAHHGSGTSSREEFIEQLRPRIALIGVGRANPYGHPVRNVLDRLEHVGAAIFRTDIDGQIEVTTDGRTIHVETFTGRHFEVAKDTKERRSTKQEARSQ
jgi:competence protein ComEC